MGGRGDIEHKKDRGHMGDRGERGHRGKGGNLKTETMNDPLNYWTQF